MTKRQTSATRISVGTMAMKIAGVEQAPRDVGLRASAAITTETGRVAASPERTMREHELGIGEHEGEEAGCGDRRQRHRHRDAR